MPNDMQPSAVAEMSEKLRVIGVAAQVAHPTHRFVIVALPVEPDENNNAHISLFSGVSPPELLELAVALVSGVQAQIAHAGAEPNGKLH
ncbi:MAG: hypothetical protein JWP57_4416 [Spirosoma sp.]|nr:hypothetical protein [Spirosoma sp.]